MSDLTDNHIQKEVEHMIIQARETKDDFIFKTIQPFCENITETKLDKKTLIKALQNYSGVYGRGEVCPVCGAFFPGNHIKHIIGRSHIYCYACGMKIIRIKH